MADTPPMEEEEVVALAEFPLQVKQEKLDEPTKWTVSDAVILMTLFI